MNTKEGILMEIRINNKLSRGEAYAKICNVIRCFSDHYDKGNIDSNCFAWGSSSVNKQIHELILNEKNVEFMAFENDIITIEIIKLTVNEIYIFIAKKDVIFHVKEYIEHLWSLLCDEFENANCLLSNIYEGTKVPINIFPEILSKSNRKYPDSEWELLD